MSTDLFDIFSQALKAASYATELERVTTLVPEASTRRYYRLHLADGQTIVGVSEEPASAAVNMPNVLAVQKFLTAGNVAVPQIFYTDIAAGIMLQQDLGDMSLNQILTDQPDQAAIAVAFGAEGIGLLRSEFLFLQRAEPPSEDEQFVAYSAMTRALNGLPLIIRTLDIGGDKEVPYLSLPAEENPFLGVRGIRLCLARSDLFRPQLRAIYRAAATGPVKIMFPMIATVEELRAARAIAEEVRVELGATVVDIGIMIEVPSAVLMAPELAALADFFSVGTNDLTQYVLAMDRGHPSLARQADALHPAVLRMIDMTVKAATAAGRWVGVCGGMAGDPKGAMILAGLGVTELSMSIPSVAAIKSRLRAQSLVDMQALAKRALACQSAAEVRAL